MKLEERIENEFKPALKARDAVKVSTLRMLKAEINNIKLDQNKKSLTDGEVTKIIQRQIKQHKDSIEQFEKGKRDDLVQKEKKELDILLGYMPKQLSDEELAKIVNETIKELGARDKREMGKVIKAVLDKAKGGVLGKRVSQVVSSILGEQT